MRSTRPKRLASRLSSRFPSMKTPITVHDGSGRGIPAETVEKLIDYSARTSSRAAYASPTRGAQGNALQTIIAMPFALTMRGLRDGGYRGPASSIASPSPPI